MQSTKYARKWKDFVLKEEMQPEYIEQVRSSDEEMNKRHAFENLFGNHWRIVIPSSLTWDEIPSNKLKGMGYELLVEIRELTEAYLAIAGSRAKEAAVSFSSKVVFLTKTETNPKTGETKDRTVPMKIGKFLMMIVKAFGDAATAITTSSEVNTFMRRNENYQETARRAQRAYNSWSAESEKIQDFKIILSRHPVDILRMSDFRALQSCHSQGGMFFECAVEEAYGHGIVAYLVKTNDLAKVKDKIDSYEEIFADDQREVDGIVPLSRARAREFRDLDRKISIALPEQRIYGVQVPELLKDFTAWLHEHQDASIPRDIRPQDFELMGGYYSDSKQFDNTSEKRGLLTLFDSYFDKSYEMHVPEAEQVKGRRYFKAILELSKRAYDFFPRENWPSDPPPLPVLVNKSKEHGRQVGSVEYDVSLPGLMLEFQFYHFEAWLAKQGIPFARNYSSTPLARNYQWFLFESPAGNIEMEVNLMSSGIGRVNFMSSYDTRQKCARKFSENMPGTLCVVAATYKFVEKLVGGKTKEEVFPEVLYPMLFEKMKEEYPELFTNREQEF